MLVPQLWQDMLATQSHAVQLSIERGDGCGTLHKFRPGNCSPPDLASAAPGLQPSPSGCVDCAASAVAAALR